MADIQKKYNELQKKHKLPDYAQLNSDFEISVIDKEEFLLREVRRKIYEKIDKFVQVLDTVLQPEANVKDMQECHVFTEKEKERIYELYKRMMFYLQYSNETALFETDEESARFITESSSGWQSIKKELKPIVSKLKESWKEETTIQEVLNYMG